MAEGKSIEIGWQSEERSQGEASGMTPDLVGSG